MGKVLLNWIFRSNPNHKNLYHLTTRYEKEFYANFIFLRIGADACL